MTKIDLFSGFLGAGKTTLIKKLIQETYKDEKIVIIENEFGDIGIDSHFLEEAGIEIKEMNSGCICCSLVGDFQEALKKVYVEYQPTRIFIEPSGVGKLSDVMAAVKNGSKECDYTLDHVICVVDAKKMKMYMKNFGEFYNDQIENAKVIILSRTSEMSEDALDACIHQIKEKNHAALIIATPWDKISGELMLQEMENEATFIEKVMHEHHHEDCECGHEHHHEDCECEHDHHHEDCECEHDHHHEDCECGHAHHHEDCECEHEHHHEDCECEHAHHHEDCECGHAHHHADEVFTSWGMETMHVYSENELRTMLDSLSTSLDFGTVLRAKGLIRGKEDCWYAFDMVPEEVNIRRTTPQIMGRICVIGAQLHEQELKQLFQIKD